MASGQALRGGLLLVVIGELLLVVCSLCYLAWWVITFRPSGRTLSGVPFLAGAVLGGLAGLILLGLGIADLLPTASSSAVGATIVGGVLVGALLLFLTATVAHRPVTTELPLIVVWGTAQLTAGTALRTAGLLEASASTAWVIATAIATLIGLACYLVFYRLDPIPAYWVGMVPLAVDGVVAAILVAVVASGRVA